MNMDVTLKAVSILMIAGICIASPPTAHDGRCSINQAIKPVTKCAAHRYQYNNKTNLCEPVCCSSAPFSSFLDCSQTCRSIEVCFVHRPVASCGSGLVTVYYFNTRTGTCLKDQGCSFKGNNFPSLEECQRTCRAKTNVQPPAVPGRPCCTQTTPSSTGGKPSFTPQTPQLPPSRPIFPPQSSQPWGGGMPSSNQHQGSLGQATNIGILRPPAQQPWQPNTTISSSHQPSQQPQKQWGIPFPPVRPEQQGQRAHDSRCNVSVPMRPARQCSGYSYQFDHRTHSCRPLMCGAAPFSTFMECSETCRSREVCFMYRPSANCKSKLVTVYYFDTLKDVCLEDRGCSYKGNNFPTLEECQRTCRARIKGPSQAVPGLSGNTLPSLPNNGGASSFPQQIPQLPVRPAPPQQGGGRPSSNQQQGAQDETTSGMIPTPGHRPWKHNNSAAGARQPPRLPGSSIISNTNNGGASSFPQRIQQLPGIIPLPTQQGAEGLSSSHHQGNQRQTTPGLMTSPGHKPWNPNTSPPHSQQWPSLPGNSLPSHPNNEGAPSFPQQMPQLPTSTPAPPQQGVGRPSYNHQHGSQSQTTPVMMPPPEHNSWNLNTSAPSSHQRPGLTSHSFPSHPNNGESSSFPQQIPQLPVSIRVPPPQRGGSISSTHPQENQRQTTPGMMSSPGRQPWSPSQSESSSHQRPGLQGNIFPSQQNTGGAQLFPSQIPQLPVSASITPQESAGMPPSNYQQGTVGQRSSGTTSQPAQSSWHPNSVTSTSSDQKPQQPWHSQFPPANLQQERHGGGTQFPQQSQELQWNGPGMTQQSSAHVSNHATTQNTSLNQHGTRPLSMSTQRPGQESRIGRVESPNSEHNAPHQWVNGVQPGNTPHSLAQHSSSGMMSPSQQPQWQNPAGTSYITQPSQQQHWGSGNVPQNLQPHLSAQVPSANSQQRQASSWRNGAPAAGQPQSTAAQPANGAGQVLPNRSTQPSWNGYVESVGSQGSQQAQSRSWRSGIPPGSQQNTAAQHTGGAGLPIPIHFTQPSMSGESRSQSWSTPATSASSPLNAQQQQDNELPSQLPTSFATSGLNQLTQQSTHQRMLSIQQQTVRHSLRRQSIST